MQALLPTPENLQTLVLYLRQSLDPDAGKRKIGKGNSKLAND